MANENVILNPEDSRFEMPDIDSLLEDGNQTTVEEPEKQVNVKDINPYLQVGEADPDNDDGDEGGEQEPINTESIIHQYLKSKGVSDPSKLQFEDEDGNPYEANFDELSTEEQLTILEDLGKPNITDEEIQTIDYLRRNNMTLAQVVDHFANQRLQEYIKANGEPQKTYKIDEYTDDELYVSDLKSKYPEFSDEELLAKLDSAKGNSELFDKEISQLRNYYKAQEEQELEDQKNREAVAQQEYVDTLYGAVNSFNEIAIDYKDPESDTVEIETSDKQRIMSYLLDKDAEGKTQFVRDIENPDTLIELAYLRTCGADLMSTTAQYWKDAIKTAHKENARLKKQVEKDKSNNTVVVQTPRGASKNSSSPWDISGLI